MSSRRRRWADQAYVENGGDANRESVLVELADTHEPPWWEARVERLYRLEVIPRLEGKANLSEVEKRVLGKARAFLAHMAPQGQKEKKMELDEILGKLQEARSAALSDAAKSRELSLVVTKIDEAILWRQFDLQIKAPARDDVAPAKEAPGA